MAEDRPTKKLSGTGEIDEGHLPVQREKAAGGETMNETAAMFESWLRGTIEAQPYRAALIALGIGWLLGRSHRPL
jgi:hypothetical protein